MQFLIKCFQNHVYDLRFLFCQDILQHIFPHALIYSLRDRLVKLHSGIKVLPHCV